MIVSTGAAPRCSEGQRRWGFVSPSAKDPEARPDQRMRAGHSSMFKGALRRHCSCLAAADRFYDWKKEARRKTPFFVRLHWSRATPTYLKIRSHDAEQTPETSNDLPEKKSGSPFRGLLRIHSRCGPQIRWT